MRIAGLDKTIHNLAHWSQREEWLDASCDVTAAHILPTCERMQFDIEELADLIGPKLMDLLLSWAMEDFFTTRFDDDGVNVVDDYLKRRGWREGASARHYLEALRDSVVGLYEVVDVVPGRQMIVEDLVRGEAPITVCDTVAPKAAASGDRCAARIVTANRENYFTFATLPFLTATVDQLLVALETIAPMRPRATADGGHTQTEEQQDWPNMFRELGPRIAADIWLADMIALSCTAPSADAPPAAAAHR